MRYTQIPSDTFEELQLNAGIIVDDFTPSTGVIGNILGATSGGVNFTATPSFIDFGEDIDNCPKNMMELKRIDYYDVSMSGTFVTVNSSRAQSLIGAADAATVSQTTVSKITPRQLLDENDFDDLWWIGDYSDKNGDTNGGFLAIHMMNALSTGGFQIQSGDKAKGQFAFTYTAHYSIDAQDTVPFELYVKDGTAEPTT